MKRYEEDEYLMLSGIQHFSFCRRQWALIHIEQQWVENDRTVDGDIMHKRAHDREMREKRGDLIIVRGMAVSSPTLGITGECDVVEFHRDDQNGVSIFGEKGRYTPLPIEYKRGQPKETEADVLQLAAQAMCLEEMLCCEIPVGYLFYGSTKRRTKVLITDQIREDVRALAYEMHQYYARGYTPKAKRKKSCNACSLKDICLPVLQKKEVTKYLESKLYGEESHEEIT
ncbi:MAG: CRISPR-associated protein Cas4 [Eubacteriales bacterium]|nr:CRISPR-associated protein Cas4 [Eubacteriales bacterium]